MQEVEEGQESSQLLEDNTAPAEPNLSVTHETESISTAVYTLPHLLIQESGQGGSCEVAQGVGRLVQAGHCQGMTGDGVGVRVGAAADLASTCPRPPRARAWRGRPGGRRCRRPPPPRPSPRPAAPDWALSATGRGPGGGRGPAPQHHWSLHWSHGHMVTGPMKVKAARSRSQPRMVRLPGCTSLSAA